jgi:putative pyruvate formate lyase activating enzyme
MWTKRYFRHATAGMLWRENNRGKLPLRGESPINMPRRHLGIQPQFLLDDYTPRYQLLSEVDAARKRSLAYAHLRNCNLCPRLCGVNRFERTGVCLIGAETAKVNVIAPHRGEEPCIQGYHGSGSVFFSGCNLRCVFCQNHVCLSFSIFKGGFELKKKGIREQ